MKKLAVLTGLLLSGLALHADDKAPKLKKDDVPKNEKQMWRRITKSQKDIEDNLMSGDPRFTAELDLTRRKVADLMLDAEGDKKNKAVVKDLSRCWNYWVRETDEIVTEDLKEYNLATAAGKSFDPADNNPQGGNPYIGAPIQYVPVPQPQPQPQAYYAPPQPQAYYTAPPAAYYPSPASPTPNPYVSLNGATYPSMQAAQYAGAPEFRNGGGGGGLFLALGLNIHAKQPRPGSEYRGTGQRPHPPTHAAPVTRATGRK